MVVLEGLQKTDSCLREREETICSNWKWCVNNPRNLEHNLVYNLNYQFADDTNIMQSNKSLQDFPKQMNFDLLNLLHWLRANKTSLTVQKIELIFCPTRLSLDPSKFKKLQGKQLIPTQSVKYLVVLLDELLQWTKQLSNVKVKFNTAFDTLSKFRHNTKQDILYTN